MNITENETQRSTLKKHHHYCIHLSQWKTELILDSIYILVSHCTH